ncbi:MAG: hypothetical protein ACO1OB_21090 [Archangium sp.]
MRSLTLVFSLSVASLFSGCPMQKECSASTCSGCCDAQGECQTGNTALACGASGNQCATCAGGTCNLGFCSNVGNGGGSGSTGGGSGSTGGGSGSTGGGTGTLTTYSDYCAAVIRIQYEYYVRCGSMTRAAADAYIASSAISCATEPVLFTSGRARFNAAGAQACVDEFRDLACDKSPLSSGCTGAITGLVANGGTCYTYGECVTGYWCDTQSTCPGSCKPQVAVGQPSATMYGEDCVDGSYRYGTTCTARVALGMECGPQGGVTSPRSCVPGAVCSTSTERCVVDTLLAIGAMCTPNTSPECRTGSRCVANTCTAEGDVNQPCDNLRTCKFGLECGPTNTCRGQGEAGAACGGGNASCGNGLFCNIASGMTTGVCTTLRGANGTCQFSTQCQSTLYCNAPQGGSGACVARLAAGATCERHNEPWACQSGLYCTTVSTGAASGVCAVTKGHGASCTSSSECSNGYCTAGTCNRYSCSP